MTTYQLYNLSGYLQWAGSLLIAISCLLFYRARPTYLKILGFYAVTSILFSIAQEAAMHFKLQEWNNPLGNGFVLSEAVLLGLLFYFVTESANFKRGVIASLIFYAAFYFFVFLFFPMYSYSYIRFGRDFLMIFYAIAYFYYLIQKLPEENLLKFPMFWINSAIIFFFSGTLILSFLRDYIVYVLRDNLAGFWAFRNIFRFTFCSILAYAGWLHLRSVFPKVAST